MDTVKRTVTRKVEIEVPTFKPVNVTKAIPILGDTQLIEQACHCLVTTWDGDAQKVFIDKAPKDMEVNFFMPNDNGAFSVFGLNRHGGVIFGMARYDGDVHSKNELEREPHYCVKAMNKADRYS